MKRLKVFNGYAGIGGNRKLWDNVDVTAVEYQEDIAITYSSFFQDDEVIIGDCKEFLRKNFYKYDFIWLSPTCQKESKMAKATRHKNFHYPTLEVYQYVIFLSNFFKGKWVVENVDPYYTPLIHPTKKIGRHLFWSNFPIGNFEQKNIKGFINKSTVKDSLELKKWLGLEYEGNLYYQGNHCPVQVLRNCVHPDTGKYILDCARQTIKDYETEQTTLNLI